MRTVQNTAHHPGSYLSHVAHRRFREAQNYLSTADHTHALLADHNHLSMVDLFRNNVGLPNGQRDTAQVEAGPHWDRRRAAVADRDHMSAAEEGSLSDSEGD